MAVLRTRKREIADPRTVAEAGNQVRRSRSEVQHVFSSGPAPRKPVAGVGGGMRVIDIFDHATDAVIERHSGQVPVEKPTSLTSDRILQGMLASILIAVLALGHVHLQFAIRDMRLQHQRMQVGYRELLQQHAQLERQTAYLKDYKRLHAYARHDLGMEETIDRRIAVVPSDVKEKYSTAVASHRDSSWGSKVMAETNGRLRKLASARFAELFDFGKVALTRDQVR